MKQPKKWREGVNPFTLKFKNFLPLKILGYPYAQNDVFYVKGKFDGKIVYAFIKVSQNKNDGFKREIDVRSKLVFPHLPRILEVADDYSFYVTQKKDGKRLSEIVGANENLQSMQYLKDYGKMLAKIHSQKKDFCEIAHRKFFDIIDKNFCEENDFLFAYDFLIKNKPKVVNKCFCHGDFHYANILWKNKHISAILDWELAGIGNKEFDVAWALFVRPSQKFLKTNDEIEEFLKGYQEIDEVDVDLVKYYMVQIYLYFYSIGKNDKQYQDYVRNKIIEFCGLK
ncbi:MAG: phosphotransferase family protein [Christensenellales bacterium]